MMHPFKHRGISRDVQGIINQLKDTLGNVIGLVPGADTMTHAVDEDGILSVFWKGLLSFKIDMARNWSPEFTGSLMRIEIGTIVEWYARDLEKPMELDQGTNWFLKFESFYGIHRRVFRKLGPEYDKIEKAFEDELSANGETVWPVIVHILKARNWILENHHYELEKIDDITYRITGVDPKLPTGYYTVEFRFRGVIEDAMLKACLDEPEGKDLPE